MALAEIGIFNNIKSNKPHYKSREYARQKMQKINDLGRDIGDIPQIVNPKRRRRARRSLKIFLETYFPNAFTLKWSPDHIKVIKKVQLAIRHGGLFAMAMPRGSGKTTIIERSILYAILYGFRKFIVPIATSADASKEILDSIIVELEGNDLLYEDFPEACYPIRKLEGIALRAKTQTANSKLTNIECKSDLLVLAQLPDSICAGARVKPVGITGRLRGMKTTLDTGFVMRPDFVILDDPQDDESAASPSQCDKREDLIAGAVLGLAGNQTKISGVMPCTIIRKGDLADRVLDRKKHPDWKGECMKLVYKFPDAVDTLWEQYKEMRILEMQSDGDGAGATQFYIHNRKEMDVGSVLAWEYRKVKGEVSALQHAMNLLYDRGEYAFYSEYQNDPIVRQSSLYNLTDEVVCATISKHQKYELPKNTHFATAFIDVNLIGLHYVVMAFRTDFTAYIIDYGKYPEGERTALWDSNNPNGMSEAQAIFRGIKELCNFLDTKPYKLGDEEFQIDGILVDGNYMTDTVYRAVDSLRRGKFPIPVLPDRGRSVKHYGIPARNKQIGRVGDFFHKEQSLRGSHVIHCSDYWRMTAQKAFFLPIDAPGSISIYHAKPSQHKKLIRHIVSEKLLNYIPGEGKKDIYQWMLTPGEHNDLLDCIVGCYVGAGLLGANFNSQERRWKHKQKNKRTKEQATAKAKNYWVSYD